MTNISISDLKTNPASAISSASNYPVAIQKRSKTQAYLVGKDIFEKLIAKLEDEIDAKAVREAKYEEVIDFEEVAKELGI